MRLKKEVTKPSILAHYNAREEVKIAADASSVGLRAGLLQKENSKWRPVTSVGCDATSVGVGGV